MRTFLVLIPATYLLLAVGLGAQTPKPATPRPAGAAPPATYKAVATVKEVMDYIIIPASQSVFDAVGSEAHGAPIGRLAHAPAA